VGRRTGDGGRARGELTPQRDAPRAAEETRDAYEEALRRGGYDSITTEIAPTGPFYYAEGYHQQYLYKVPLHVSRRRLPRCFEKIAMWQMRGVETVFTMFQASGSQGAGGPLPGTVIPIHIARPHLCREVRFA
jgi:hypothetical protein